MHIIIFIGTVNLLLFIITYFYYRMNFSLAHGWSFGLIYFFLACNNIIARALPDTTPLFLTRLSSWLGFGRPLLQFYWLLWGLCLGTIAFSEKEADPIE